jgi:putative redox protein
VVKDPDFPPDFDGWAAELKQVQPVPDAKRIAPRPFLVVHGDRDDLTPLDDGRALAASHGDAEIRIIDGAGHELRHDPRAVAVFLGWLARQQASEVERLTAEEMAVELAVELADELSADSFDLDAADDE